MNVFISYSTKQAETANRVCAYLEQNGHPCWIAPRNIRPGYNYAAEIVHGISDCDYLLLLASADTNASNYVLNEVTMAFDRGKKIIPFKLQNIDFSDEFQFFLGSTHWIDAWPDINAGLLQLVQTLGAGSAPRPQPNPNPQPQPQPQPKPEMRDPGAAAPAYAGEKTARGAAPVWQNPPQPAKPQKQKKQKPAKARDFIPKKKWLAFFLCLFLGAFGVHRFYERKFITGAMFLVVTLLALLGAAELIFVVYAVCILDIIRILRKPNPYYK